ncbi:MAG: hypothetical protein K1X88_24755 [Nannocystaceae bacterium]|nr:hypothetical protein [Nannocystaceae bacterium]
MANPRSSESSPCAPTPRPLALPLLAALLTAAVGCDSKPPANAPPGGTATPAKTGDKAGGGDKTAQPASGGGDKVKVVDGGGDDRYALSFDTPEAKAGQPASVTVRVVPKAPWHMNLDFPTSLKLEPPSGVTLASAELKKGDAKLDESACSFDVKFTADKPGEQTFSGKFKFAVCQDEACSPVTEDVEFKVAVK